MLRGPAGEAVDLRRVLLSHGVAGLPPFEIDDLGSRLEGTLRAGRVVRTVRITASGSRHALIEVLGRPVAGRTAQLLIERCAHVLRLDEDLSTFYEMAADDPDLDWVPMGAGRLMRGATVFEDVVKTICTTNCAWSGTVRMVSALVEHLGDPAPGAPAGTWRGRSFPTPEAMASAPDDFYRDVARAGYRGAYLRSLAGMVVEGLDLEVWATASEADLPDEELAARLQALPGVGPYAAAHVMLMIGRYSPLILDSWTRPTYARLVGRRSVSDATIRRRFRRYGRYAGLAFWLVLTRSWVPEARV